jgi:hypothetical protein
MGNRSISMREALTAPELLGKVLEGDSCVHGAQCSSGSWARNSPKTSARSGKN